jgi:hypothetical protein
MRRRMLPSTTFRKTARYELLIMYPPQLEKVIICIES